MVYAGLVFLILLPCYAFSHTGVLTGRVTDRKSGEPVSGANIVVAGLSIGAATDADGRFRITGVPLGTLSISASSLGFLKQAQTVVAVGDSTLMEFVLVPSTLDFEEVTITGERSFSAASSEMLGSIDFELRPRQSAQDMLRLVPGLVIAQHAGGGKAEQIFVRGFDVDHGTDFNLSVDGVPVNMVSHGHGQGYADLHFVIPEVVNGMEVHKGPYSALFGDFATAGAARFFSKDKLEENIIGIEGGMFGSYRYVTALQIPFRSDEVSSYAAAEFSHSDGYFNNKIEFDRYNVFAKVRSTIGEADVLDVWASGFGSSWDASGQIPGRAVESGMIDRFGSIDPTEGGTTQRQNLSLSYFGALENASSLLTQVYFSHYRFRLFSNFTFYLADSINGDQIEQDDDRGILGVRTEYTMRNTLGSIDGTTVLGASFRSDAIDVALWRSVQRNRLANTTAVKIYQKNMSLYAQQDLQFSSLVRLQVGVRGEYFVFDVEDQRTDTTQPDISGYEAQTILNPKFNLVISPNRNLDLFLNFGGGIHSNDARVVVAEATERTLPRAWGGEIGLRYSPVEQVVVSSEVWGLDLQNEFVYVGDEGTTESSGPTRRVGVDFSGRAQVLPWLYLDCDLTFSRGRFKDLPEGENRIPLAPTFTAAAGITGRFRSGYEGSIRLRHVGDRAANESNSVVALGHSIIDMAASYRFSSYRIQMTVENLFNKVWNEAQFDTESRLQFEPAPVSELHFTPGTPRSLKVRADVFF